MKSTMSENCNAMDREIGVRLREFRRVSSISQGALGTAIGVTFQQIQKYEAGKNRISASAMVLICQQLGITPMDLLGVYFGRTDQSTGPVQKALDGYREAGVKLAAIRRIIAGTDDIDDVAFAAPAQSSGVIDSQLVAQ